MTRIEIYGYSTRIQTVEAETFCIKMGYPYVLRDLKYDCGSQAELQSRAGSVCSLPHIFIGSEDIGSFKDLMSLEPFIVQQKIGG